MNQNRKEKTYLITKPCSILTKERDLGDYCRRNVDDFHYVAALVKANTKDKPTLETRRQSNREPELY